MLKEGYYFHPDAVVNLVSMAIVSDHHCIVMDTDVDNSIYVSNDNRTYIKFQQMKQNIYSIHIGGTVETKHCYFILVKGVEMKHSALYWKREIAV